MSTTVPADVLGILRQGAVGLQKSEAYSKNVDARDEVLARYQPVFSPERVRQITEDEFRSFLLLENNHHWTGLHRQGPRICADMKRLRKALATLVDESEPIAERLDNATQLISGMGKNIASAILIVTRPEAYGVWNNRSEANLKRLDIWPVFDRGESFGSRYVKVNRVLVELRDALAIDLWTLDSLWWYLDGQNQSAPDDEEALEIEGSETVSTCEQRFGLERHLHEFMRDNWSSLELAKEWELYKEPGDDEAGYEYPCAIGRIDLLAKHKKSSRWLVIELKRNQTSDQTVGQLLRYVGWVKKNLATNGEEVHGMIICRDADESLHYALSMVPNTDLRFYEVEFHLKRTQE
jgi:hypothetical protein